MRECKICFETTGNKEICNECWKAVNVIKGDLTTYLRFLAFNIELEERYKDKK